MKSHRKELNIDALGSSKSINKVQEREISAFIQSIKDGYAAVKKSTHPKPARVRPANAKA